MILSSILGLILGEDTKMRKLIIWLTVFFLLIFPLKVNAKEATQIITLVNPIRISVYSQKPVDSLKNQYEQVANKKLAASWLLTYDILSFPGIKEVIQTMNIDQDIGIFMEVTENFATNMNITYQKTDSWHRSNSLFLSGYSQVDRIKFIDGVFEKFKLQFGYYPTSVGAWWIDSFSLEYMQKKYGVNANLVVADQLGTDGYTIWGQYWAAPYYPSRNHAAMPAQSIENKLDLVNLQWAPRDPLNGYKSPGELRGSLYSTQDYYSIGLEDSYLEGLINLYAGRGKNEFGQITFGLEGDFSPETYLANTQYSKYLDIAKKFAEKGNFTIANMQQFSHWYRQKYPNLSQEYIVESEDLLKNTKNKVIWYQNPNYRAGLVFDESSKKLRLIDLRVYQKNFQEPFFSSINGQIELNINLPSVIDTVIDPQRYLEFENIDSFSTSKVGDRFKIDLGESRSIEFFYNKITLNNTSQILPGFLTRSDLVQQEKSKPSISLTFLDQFPAPVSGYKFRDLKIEATYFLRTTRVKITVLGFLILLLFLFYKFNKSVGKEKILFMSFIILLLTCITFLYLRNTDEYYVSQSEVDALLKLKTYPLGKVLILDRDCLHCKGQIGSNVAAFANKRSYVGKLGSKNLGYDTELIEVYSKNFTKVTKLKPEETKSYLKKRGIKYIYLVKHEDYIEKLPFSPGDLGVEQIYFNSDAQIWRVKT